MVNSLLRSSPRKGMGTDKSLSRTSAKTLVHPMASKVRAKVEEGMCAGFLSGEAAVASIIESSTLSSRGVVTLRIKGGLDSFVS